MECRLKHILQEKGITVKELSKSTGISVKTLNKYIDNNIKQITFKTLNLLCEQLDCTTSDIISINL